MDRVDGRAPARGFVVMPFGKKKAADGREIDFNLVYDKLIAPAMLAAGVEPHRADQDQRAGGIHGDMFQDLLLADLVVADLTIDNPNAYYELGVRHALRDSATVSIFSSDRPFLPFDVVGERSLLYTPIAEPLDDEAVAADRLKLKQMILATLAAWHGRKTSPVYRALPSLEEPNWKRLKVGDINEFWQSLETWEGLISTALSKQRPGDILLLADETPTRILELEAIRTASRALLRLDSIRYALAIIERGLALGHDDLWLRQQQGIALARAGRFHDARARLSALAEQNRSGETLSLLGRSYKDQWLRLWRGDGTNPEQIRTKAKSAATFLEMAAEAYAKAFRLTPADSYPGINALTLGHLWQDLTGKKSKLELDLIAQGVRWAADCVLKRCEADTSRDYWAYVSRGELRLVTEPENETALEDYEDAAAQAVIDSDRFALQWTRQHLEILIDLDFRSSVAAKAVAIIGEAESHLARLQGARLGRPQTVVLFSGHMIDDPTERGDDRELKARFPAAKVEAAKLAIVAELDRIKAGASDLGLCGGACGGDLLFAEACLDRGMSLEVRLPRRIPQFLAQSVTFADPDQQWVNRFDRVLRDPLATVLVQPDEVGPAPKDADIHDRNNRWQLYSALSLNLDNLHFITLWDGKPKKGAGGTQHMVERIRELTGRAPVIIDPASL